MIFLTSSTMTVPSAATSSDQPWLIFAGDSLGFAFATAPKH
jgi:hypothetical protein